MSKWVSVKDGLPNACINVLVYVKRNSRLQQPQRDIDIDFYIFGSKRHGDGWNDYHRTGEYDFHVTHWMPLPKPPETNKKRKGEKDG